MPGDLSVSKIYVVGTGEPGASSSVEATDDKKVSVYGTDIVQETDSDFSATPLSESPAKEAFKHFGKKYDDLAMMDTNNTIAKLQMQLDDFAAECPNAKLPKLPNMPDPAKFEKGKAVSCYAMIQEHKIDLSPEDLQALSQPQSEQPLQ